MNHEPEPVYRDNHHVFFERRNYRTPIERQIRNLGAFIIKGNAVYHRELHIHVPPPPKPEPEQLHDLYDFMQEHTYQLDGLEGLEWAIVFANDRRIYDLEQNLEYQHNFLSGAETTRSDYVA